jgi:hypothetical protein
LPKRLLVGLAIVLGLLACDQKAWFDKFVPKEEAAFAEHYIALFQAHDFDAIEAGMDPKLKGPQLRAKLEQLAALFPAEQVSAIAVVGANTVTSGDATRFNLTFQYQFPTKWLLANVVLDRRAGALTVMGVSVNAIPDGLENINSFTLGHKPASDYIVLAFAILVPLFIIGSLVSCFLTPIPKRKWLWLIFILFGLGQVTVNWTTGGLNYAPVSFQLLGAGFFRVGAYAPWLVTVSIPVGAILFWLKRRRWLQSAGSPPLG